jgi:hypothetical protein
MCPFTSVSKMGYDELANEIAHPHIPMLQLSSSLRQASHAKLNILKDEVCSI